MRPMGCQAERCRRRRCCLDHSKPLTTRRRPPVDADCCCWRLVRLLRMETPKSRPAATMVGAINYLVGRDGNLSLPAEPIDESAPGQMGPRAVFSTGPPTCSLAHWMIIIGRDGHHHDSGHNDDSIAPPHSIGRRLGGGQLDLGQRPAGARDTKKASCAGLWAAGAGGGNDSSRLRKINAACLVCSASRLVADKVGRAERRQIGAQHDSDGRQEVEAPAEL